MRVKATLQKYEELEFSITLTASVKDWRSALKQLRSLSAWSVGWPLSGFVACIDKMLFDLDKTHADVLVNPEQVNVS